MKIRLNQDITIILIMIVVTVILFFIPTGFEDNYNKSIRSKALVISVDNSQLEQRGIVKTGVQQVKVRILQGEFKGKEFNSTNNLKGQLELDKMFSVGDKALVVIDHQGDEVVFVNIIDHYRINIEAILFSIFILILIAFAGITGVKTVISFIFTILAIWKILIPSFLKGYDPVVISLIITTIIMAVTIYLVGGLNKKSLVAFLGAFIGMVATCILSLFFGKEFNLHGAVVPFSETLLYSGYGNLNITRIFLAGIFIASSGALMDVAMDISAAVYEIVSINPKIHMSKAIKSGFSVSRAVIGTMATTLLLAYSGGYTAMLMVFMAQGTPVINILNMTYVSAEILHTLVGSFGLVLVAPATSILSGLMFTRKSKKVTYNS